MLHIFLSTELVAIINRNIQPEKMMVSNQIKLLLLGCESLQCALRVQPREWWAARKQTGEHGDDFDDGDDEDDDIDD